MSDGEKPMPDTEGLETEWRELAAEMDREDGGPGYPPGRNDLPAMLFDAYEAGRFVGRPDLHAWAVCDAYNAAEYPCRSVDAGTWVGWFEELGYVENGVRVDRPDAVPTLYRAAQPDELDEQLGLSWTASRSVAEMFHERHRTLGWAGVLLQTSNVPTEAVLARLHGPDFRDEDEYLLDNWADIEVQVIDQFEGVDPDEGADERAEFWARFKARQAALVAEWESKRAVE